MGLSLRMRLGAGKPSRGGAPLVFPLDLAGALPLAAYGVKRMSDAYSGPAIRVRRSDAVEVDIGFDGQNLDAAAVVAHLGTAAGSITTFYDLTGNGNHATQTTIANQGVIRSDMVMAGSQAVTLGEIGWYNLPAGITIDRRNGEVCGVLEFYTSKQQAGVFEIGAVSGAVTAQFQLTGTYRSFPPGNDASFKAQCKPSFFDLNSSASGWNFEQDGETRTGAAVTSVTASGGFFGKPVAPVGYYGKFFHGMIAFYNRVLAVGERAALKAACDSLFNCNSTGGVLIYNGDSITASSDAPTLRNGWAHKVTPLLTAKPKQFNYAIPGEQLVNDLVGGSSNFNNDELPILTRYTSERRIVVVHKGTNDMGLGSRTSAQLYADLQTYCGSVRTNGGMVIVSTLLPRTSYGTSTLAEFTTFNSSVRTNWASFADGFIDFANEPTMGGAGAAANTTLYRDGLHPTAYGNGLLAAFAAPEIDRVFALP